MVEPSDFLIRKKKKSDITLDVSVTLSSEMMAMSLNTKLIELCCINNIKFL